ncbi:MAG TPA: TadE family protein [Bryobacteraceae bacterium]|nr:TadE family protein [Bryobacteraceae bacterium]
MRARSAGRRSQSGLTSVEFAIIGGLLMVLVFGIMEVGRALYVMNMLTEAARRGARMAAVCPVGDPKPASVAVFSSTGSTSPVVYGLTTANIVTEYLDVSGNPIANAAANFTAIRYVRTRITGFSLSLLIPIIMPTLPMNGFSATLPRESLGIPRAGTVTPC